MNRTAPKFYKAAICRRAWEIVKAGPDWQAHIAIRLKYAMRDAWAEARRASAPAMAPARAEIISLENKTRLTFDQQARLAVLRRVA